MGLIKYLFRNFINKGRRITTLREAKSFPLFVETTFISRVNGHYSSTEIRTHESTFSEVLAIYKDDVKKYLTGRNEIISFKRECTSSQGDLEHLYIRYRDETGLELEEMIGTRYEMYNENHKQ